MCSWETLRPKFVGYVETPAIHDQRVPLETDWATARTAIMSGSAFQAPHGRVYASQRPVAELTPWAAALLRLGLGGIGDLAPADGSPEPLVEEKEDSLHHGVAASNLACHTSVALI